MGWLINLDFAASEYSSGQAGSQRLRNRQGRRTLRLIIFFLLGGL